MKTIKLSLCLWLAALLPHFALADLVGNYTPDANTLFLLHFDGPAGTSVVTNYGTKGGYFYTANLNGSHTASVPVTTMLGQTSYVSGPTNFNLCLTNPASADVCGYDFNNNGTYDIDSDALAMTNLNIGLGGQSSFTIEAVISPSSTSGNQEIICTDSDGGSASVRAFQFRISGGTLQFQFINGGQNFSGTIPTTGNDAFVAGNWYHVALSYNGSTATLYWTLLNGTNGAAHVLTSAALTMGTTQGATTGSLAIGNNPRDISSEQFLGKIDEVRISSVARGPGQMQFYSPLVSLTQNPVSQNVDYNQPVTFNVGAASQFPLGYQWRFNSNSIAGATNTAYVITNVAASNAGYYDCVVTNTISHSATSSEGLLVVGAANFIANRYSFNTSSTDPTSGLPTTPDSIGGQTGTNFGNATVSGGQLVLDGSAGTFMQLPGNLFNAANATALTFEFWATFGTNPNNVYPFSFGRTNYVTGSGIVGFNYLIYSSHNTTGQSAISTPGDPGVSTQSVSAPGNLDGLTVHVAVVVDPPNKQFSIYTNGVLEAINTNFTINISSLNDQLSYVGQSLYAADPYLNASIDELRIFKGALSGISIKQSQDQGPNTLLADGPAKFILLPVSTSVPVGQSATFTAATVGYLPITYQWFKNGTLVPGATNASYTLSTALTDNNSSIQVIATNTIGVTTYVTNSPAVTLNVFVPPTLAWLDSTHGGADSTWNTTSLDWINVSGGSVIAFAQTNGVLFDSRGAGSANVDIGSAIIPYNITVNAASDYMLYSSANTGLLTGQASLTKQNSDTLIIDLTNNLTGATTISGGKLQVGNGDTFGTLGSGPVTNNATLSINRADAVLNLGNAIHGTGVLNIDGSGSVTVTGNSDYSGSTLINQGILNLQSGTGLGGGGLIQINSGGQLYITANVDIGSKLLLINGTGDGNGALRKGGAGATTYNGSVTLLTDTAIGVDGGATLTLSNTVSGAAALTAVGTGTLTLSANNTFNGGFTLNGPVINLNANHALGSGTATVSGTGRFVIGDGLNITNFILASTVSPGTATGLFMVNDNTNGTVTTISGPIEFDATPANGSDFIGPISSGYLNVTGPITNTATGAVGSRNGFVRFSGGGNYSTFTLNQGTASIGANNGLSTNASLAIAGSAAATFDLNGFNQALTGLSDGAANAELVTNSAAGPSTLTLNLSSGGTYSGVIAGNLALVVNGLGNNLDLAGTNAYTGNTTVTSGTLELATPSLAANSKVTVASGAQLQLDFSVTNTVSGLVLNGVSQPLGVYNNTTSPTYIIGSGSLLVAVTGPGTFTNPTGITSLSLNGANITLNATNGQAGCAYYLLSTTNLALPRNQWTPVATNVLSSNGAYTFIGTNAVTPGASQQFYILSNTNN